MKVYAVIDTNVIVSSLLKRDSIPGKILDYVINGTLVPILNDGILTEYQDVLVRNKFGFNDALIKNTINDIRAKSIFLDGVKTPEIFTDESDAIFYEITMNARSTMEAYLVTGNIKHFPAKKYVVTPREMVDIITNSISNN